MVYYNHKRDEEPGERRSQRHGRAGRVPQKKEKKLKKALDKPGNLCYNKDTSGGKATEESEAYVSDASPDNTLKRLVKLGATHKGRGSPLKKILDKPDKTCYNKGTKGKEKEIKKMYRCYAGGWDCKLACVEKWIANGQVPDAIYSSLEEASKNACYDMDLCPDDTVWMVYPDGHIDEFIDW